MVDREQRAPGSSGHLEGDRGDGRCLSCLREGTRSFSSISGTVGGLVAPLLGSVGQFFGGCFSQVAVVLAILALGLSALVWASCSSGPTRA